MYVNVTLPNAASLQRTDQVCRKIEEIIKNTPGVEHYQTLVGNSLVSVAPNTYSGFFFVTLKEWNYRTKPEEDYQAIMAHLNTRIG